MRLPGGRFRFMWSCFRWLISNKREFDVVFALDNLLTALAANLACKIARRPIILVLLRPTVDYFRCKRPTGVLTGWRYFVGITAVRVLTPMNERLAAASAPCSRFIAGQTKGKRVVVIPSYGVDTDAYTPGDKAASRSAAGLPPDATIIFCRSRIAPEKDPDTFIRAVEMVASRREGIKALYVGAEFRDFLQFAAPFKVEVITVDHVHPLEGLPVYYRSADVAVQTSRSEGLGLSPLESLCCGVPVVVSATGGLLETIHEKKTGLLAPPGDAVATAEAIEWLLDHPGEGQETARTGRRLVEEEYSSKVALARWKALAESLAK